MATIGGALRSTALRQPDSDALKFGDRSYTYAELDEWVDRAAHVLTDYGVRKGDRLGLMGANSDHFVIAFFAALRLGAIVVPVNPASAPMEVDYLVEDSGATAVVFDPGVAATIQGLSAPPPVLLALSPTTGYQDLMTLASLAASGPAEDPACEDDDALLLYTSGTTGKPKGALFDHHRSLWVGFVSIGTFGMRIGDRFLHVAPLYHAAELCALLIPGTMIGATHVVMPGFDPGAVLDAMETERVTMFFGVPTMYQFLLRDRSLPQRDLSAWRVGLFGAAPMPGSTVEQLIGALPNVELMQMCGQTEAGPGGIFSTYEQVKARPDASGRQPLLFTESAVVTVDGEPVAPGEVGELVLRGETIMKGYWNKPEETAATLRGGWLHTGDLARLDADGYITLVDRLKDMIITGGRNVYSVEVENAIAAHPDILECAVISKPHPDYGESIVAVVVPAAGRDVTLESVRSFCADRISSYKMPHELVIAAIPRNPSGKVLKHKIRESLMP